MSLSRPFPICRRLPPGLLRRPAGSKLNLSPKRYRRWTRHFIRVSNKDDLTTRLATTAVSSFRTSFPFPPKPAIEQTAKRRMPLTAISVTRNLRSYAATATSGSQACCTVLWLPERVRLLRRAFRQSHRFGEFRQRLGLAACREAGEWHRLYESVAFDCAEAGFIDHALDG